MSTLKTAVWRRLLACVLVAAVSANAGENKNHTKREVATPFLSDVIRRIENDRQQVARPVQDLQVALDRIAEIFGPEATPLEEAPIIFELPENAETLPTASTTPLSNAVSPTSPTGMKSPPGTKPPPGTRSPPSSNGDTDTLSPQDLQHLYEIAAKKGLTLDLSAIQRGVLPSSANFHSVKDGSIRVSGPTPLPPSSTGSTPDQAEGYYYYFVPIKNLQGHPQQQMMQVLMKQPNPESSDGTAMGSSSNSAADAMASAALMAGGADRAVEPLFMAMAGFVGMALMFVASVLFLPKLGALRSLKHAPDEMASIGKLVLQSIEGKDCSERLTCEIARGARTLRLSGKPLRVLELLLPPPMSVQISRIRRAVARKDKCNFIPCKFRRPPSFQLPPKKPLVKPPVKPSLFKPASKPPNRPVQNERPYPPPEDEGPYPPPEEEGPYPPSEDEGPYPPPPTRPSIFRPPPSNVKWSTSPRPPPSPRPYATSPRPAATSPRPATTSSRPAAASRPPPTSLRPAATSPRPPGTSTRPPAASPRPHWSPKPSAASRPSTSRPPQQRKNHKASPKGREPRFRR